jgi:periplasmic protein TonB
VQARPFYLSSSSSFQSEADGSKFPRTGVSTVKRARFLVDDMFHTLENTWDQSACRRWTTVASFTVEALALSVLLLIPLLTIQGPPRLLWFDARVLAPPPAPPPMPPGVRQIRPSVTRGEILLQPLSIPAGTPSINHAAVPAAPDVSGFGVRAGTGDRTSGIARSVGDLEPIAPPPIPRQTDALRVSHWAEGNLIYRVQPRYPALARQVRIQGTVELRAIIGKTGTIENLSVVSGHPMLIPCAIEAVRQWRYRPYMLNGESIEVETDIIVNFTLEGN